MRVSSRIVSIGGDKPAATRQHLLSRTLFLWLLFTLLICRYGLPARAQTFRALNAGGEASPGDPSEIAHALRKAQLAVQSRLEPTGDIPYKSVEGTAEWSSLRAASARLRAIDLHSLDSSGKRLAFWINVYNALVLDGIISFKVRRSVLDVRDFFQRARYQVGGHDFCLDDIEHGLLRGNRAAAEGKKPPFKPDDPRRAFAVPKLDPRIHFALSCGAKSCPAISTYDAEKIEAQLDAAAGNFINGPDVQIEPDQKRVILSQIFQWYAGDFGPERRDMLRFVAHCLKDNRAKQFIETHLDSVSVRYSTYDWALAHNP